MSECKMCNGSGTILVRCHYHGDISHAEPCICHYENYFMQIHAINDDTVMEEE